MKICIIAEAYQHKLLPITFELLTRARDLGVKGIGALVLSDGLPDEELARLMSCGTDEVVYYEAPWLGTFRPEPYCEALAATVAEFKPEIILGGATTTGRTWLPYAAMRLQTGLTADCTGLAIEENTGLLLQTRPAIGGNIMATIKTPNNRPQMATVRPRSTPQAQPIPKFMGTLYRMTPLDSWNKSHSTLINATPVDEAQELSAAKRIVVVGRGIRKPENIPLARELADCLGAALGATREVVDRGWLPYSCQIGLSGRTVTPELYVGLGVSGAIQHLAGMQTSKRIVAVNTDPEAQLFSISDLSIVGNVMDVVPALIAKVRQGGNL